MSVGPTPHTSAGLQSGPFCEKYAWGLWSAASKLDGKCFGTGQWSLQVCPAGASHTCLHQLPSPLHYTSPRSIPPPHSQHLEWQRRHSTTAGGHGHSQVCHGSRAPARFHSPPGFR